MTSLATIETRPAAAFRGRVLVVGNFLSGRGTVARQVCEELAERLAATGVETITTSSKTGRTERMIDMAATAWKRRRDYDVAQVDVFSGRSFLWAEAVCAVARMAGKPYILTLHGGALPKFFAKWPRRATRLLRGAAAVTVPSGYLLEQLQSYHDRLTLTPNAIEVGRYGYRQRTSPEATLVWLRSFHRIYNPELAPRVVALLKDEFPDVRLTMTGPDKDGSLKSVKAEAWRLSVEDRIRYVGAIPKEQVPEAMAAGDIYLNTTNVDNMPVTLLEAMACGTCVVSTDVGGVPHIVTHEGNGLLAPACNAEAMAAAVRRLLIEKGLAGRISAAGRRTAEQYDWSAILPRWNELFEQAIREAQS
ncbi:MAG: glycosyltransferase family 4 protein [Bryobacteraceae bacterium]